VPVGVGDGEGEGDGEGVGVAGGGMVQLWLNALVPPNIGGKPLGPATKLLRSEILISLPKADNGTKSQRGS
jgi:hypothetical protein